MKKFKYSDQELRFTAVLYARRRDVMKSLNEAGRLPEGFMFWGLHIGARLLEREIGRDPVLSKDEQRVYEAILREKRLPGGGIILAPDSVPIFAMCKNQPIDLRRPKVRRR